MFIGYLFWSFIILYEKLFLCVSSKSAYRQKVYHGDWNIIDVTVVDPNISESCRHIHITVIHEQKYILFFELKWICSLFSFVVCLTVTEYLCHMLLWLCSVYRSHTPVVHSSFLTHHRIWTRLARLCHWWSMNCLPFWTFWEINPLKFFISSDSSRKCANWSIRIKMLITFQINKKDFRGFTWKSKSWR